MRFLALTSMTLGLWAASAQTPEKTPAPKLAGFPFQDETLRYSVRWPSGLTLGEASMTAHRAAEGWNFETTLQAGVPGFAVSDTYSATAGSDLCSLELDRAFSHGSKKTREKTTFDRRNRRAHRETVLPPNGGKSDIDTSSCARDALTFVYFARREMGQGRVAPPEQVYFGSAYSTTLRYTGEMTIPVAKKPTVTDHVVASIKGPNSQITAEIFFARDPARTPLLIKIPLAVGTVSVELVR